MKRVIAPRLERKGGSARCNASDQPNGGGWQEGCPFAMSSLASESFHIFSPAILFMNFSSLTIDHW